MTEKDNTGDQLAASVRKTKRTATTRKTSAQRATAPAKSNPQAKPAGGSNAQAERQTSEGTYSSGRRVWPD